MSTPPVEETPPTPPPPPPPPSPAREPDPFEARLRRASRRGFTTAGLAVLAGYGAWRWLVGRQEEDGLIWPLRRILRGNEALGRALFGPSRRAPEFPPGRAREPRVNGLIGMHGPFDPTAWRLNLAAGGAETRLGLADLRAMPRAEQTTELKCIEGWSTVVRWAGVRLADVAARTGLASRSGRPYEPARPPADLFEYVGLETPDGGYYVGLDAASALHPQTLLAFEMDGRPLAPEHGAPLRLVIPVKYGIKNIKRIGTIRFTDARPADYWAERGYDWYAGH